MSIEWSYDPQEPFVRARLVGELTVEDLVRFMDALVGSDAFPPDIDLIWDQREADFSSFDSEVSRSIVDTRARYPQRGRGRTATVVSDDLAFGLTRMHEAQGGAMSEVRLLRVFKDLGEAERWLRGGDPD